MESRVGEQTTELFEATPLGVVPDPDKVDLFKRFLTERCFVEGYGFMKGHGFDHVYSLWKDPDVTDPTIRQCAVTVLTAPRACGLISEAVGRLAYIHEKADGSDTSSLRERLRGRPELAEELAAGVLHWLEQTGGDIEHSNSDLEGYQRVIRELMPLVGEETAQKLFMRYSFRDTASLLGPLAELLGDAGIHRKYKDICVTHWLEAIEQEQADAAESGRTYKPELDRLARFVGPYTHVDADTYAVLVACLEKHMPAGVAYEGGYVVRRTAERIGDVEVWFQFAHRHIMHTDWNSFRVSDDNDLMFATRVQEEAEKRGLDEVRLRAERLIEAYRIACRERAAARAAEAALQAELRRE